MSIFSRKYSDSELSKILENLTIISDSREKKNDHIVEQFNKNNIKCETRKLDFADYSFIIPPILELDINEELSFANHISIERKNSVDELAINITKNRSQFKAEYERHKGLMILMIEDSGGYGKICEGNYRSKVKPLSYIGTIHGWQFGHNVPFIFIDKTYSAQYIYYTFRYYLRYFIQEHNNRITL